MSQKNIMLRLRYLFSFLGGLALAAFVIYLINPAAVLPSLGIFWLVLAAWFFFNLLRLVWIIYATKGFRQRAIITDISAQNKQVSAKFNSVLSDIASLGFQRFGEVSISYQGIPLLPSSNTWGFVNAEQNTLLTGILDKSAVLMLTSQFADGFSIETAYPLGYTIDHPELYSQTVRSSLSIAYDYHLQQIQRFSAEHGAINPIPTMSQIIEYTRLGDKFYWLKIWNFYPLFFISRLLIIGLFIGIGITFLVGLTDASIAILYGVFLVVILSLYAIGNQYKNRAVDARKKKDYADTEAQMV